MAGPRARRMNVPLRGVAAVSGVMLFALLGNVTWVQGFRYEELMADPRNNRTMILRFDEPRGEVRLRDGTVVAASERVTDQRFAYRRVYPQGALYAPATGYASLYRTTGIEGAEDGSLTGEDPRVRVRALLKDIDRGATVTLTLDSRAQKAAYDGLAATGKRGAVVALDPRTGAILAMVSLPSFDPNGFATFDVDELTAYDRKLQRDPARPLLNRAIGENYPPGSTFKVITAAAALASGDYDPETEVRAPARMKLPGTQTWLRNSGGEACGDGTPALLDAFVLSCNTAFADLGLELGEEKLSRWAGAFGFGDAALKVPLAVAESVYPSGLDRAQTAMSAIGQYDDRATPLSIAMISAAVANGGSLMRPYLVDEVRLRDGTIVRSTDPDEYRDTMPMAVADRLTEMMVAVTGPGGTGTAAAIPGVKVAAKTGTAENEGSDHAIFTAFAPADDPVVAVGVLVEHGGFGGQVAAPIARAVMRALL
ncbi:peptidoglycan D,D-transpeptidase FtsI family protein [Herbidospora sp. RD11066]